MMPQNQSPYNAYAPRGGGFNGGGGPDNSPDGPPSFARPVLPPLRRPGAFPAVMGVMPGEGAISPYKPQAPAAGYGADTLLSTFDLVSVEDDASATRLTGRQASEEQDRKAGLLSGPTVRNEGIISSQIPADAPLPDAAFLLFDTSSPAIPDHASMELTLYWC